MAKSKKLKLDKVTIDVVNEKISTVLEMVKPHFSGGLAYSTSLLCDEDGNELLISLHVANESPITTFNMIAEAVGMEIRSVDYTNIVIAPPEEICDDDECSHAFLHEPDDDEVPF